MLSKIKTVRKLWHFRCKLETELHPLLPSCVLNTSLCQHSDHQMFYSSTTFVVWTKLGLNCQTACFVVFSWIFGCFWDKFQQIMQLLLQNCQLETPRLVIVEFLKPFYARKFSTCKKNSKLLSFANIWVILRKPSTISMTIFWKTWFGLSFIISNFSKFLIYRNFPIWKFTENIGNRRKLPNFRLLADNFRPFSNRSLQIFL